MNIVNVCERSSSVCVMNKLNRLTRLLVYVNNSHPKPCFDTQVVDHDSLASWRCTKNEEKDESMTSFHRHRTIENNDPR